MECCVDEKKFDIIYPATNGGEPIKTMDRDGKILFRFPDVVRVLAKDNENISYNTGVKSGFGGLLSKLSSVLKEKEKYIIPLSGKNEYGFDYEFYITEAGLYRIVTIDDSEASVRFQDWIFEDVLPSIRKYGIYPPPKEGASELSTMVALLQQNVSILAREIEKREELEKKVNVIENRVNLIEQSIDSSDMHVLVDVITARGSSLPIEQLWAWCEKIRLESGSDSQKCFSGERYKTKYPLFVIEQAINHVTTCVRLANAKHN
jgi:prophage antirepressor-like protein